MSEDLHHIDDFFKNKLEGMEELPSEDTWIGIDQKLDKIQSNDIQKRYQQLKKISAIAVIFLSGIALYAWKGKIIHFLGIQRSKMGVVQVYKEQSNKKGYFLSQGSDNKNKNAEESLSNSIINQIDSSQLNSSDFHAEDNLNHLENKELHIFKKHDILKSKINSGVSSESKVTTINQNSKSAGFSQKDSRKIFVKAQTKRIGKEFLGDAVSNQHLIRKKIRNEKRISTINQNDFDPSTNTENTFTENSAINRTSGIALSKEMMLLETNDFRINSLGSLTPKYILEKDLSFINDLKNRSTFIQTPLIRNLPRLQIIPFITANFTKVQLKENRKFPTHNGKVKKEIHETEETKVSVVPGIIVELPITSRFSLQGGISKFNLLTIVQPKRIAAVKDYDGKIRYKLESSAGQHFFDPKPGKVPKIGDSITSAPMEFITRYISFPVNSKYTFGKSRLKISMIAGAEYNILLNQIFSVDYTNVTVASETPFKTEGIRKDFLSASIGGGIDYSLSKRFSVELNPFYRFTIQPINNASPVKTFPNSFSLMAGLRYVL